MRISDWSSDVCSSDLLIVGRSSSSRFAPFRRKSTDRSTDRESAEGLHGDRHEISRPTARSVRRGICRSSEMALNKLSARKVETLSKPGWYNDGGGLRSEEHTSELQSLMRISYAVFCLKKK